MPYFNSMQSPYAYAVESGAGWSLRRHLRQTPQAAISFQACRQTSGCLEGVHWVARVFGCAAVSPEQQPGMRRCMRSWTSPRATGS